MRMGRQNKELEKCYTHTHRKKKKKKNITAWVSSQDKPISFQITKIIIKSVSTVKYTKLD